MKQLASRNPKSLQLKRSEWIKLWWEFYYYAIVSTNSHSETEFIVTRETRHGRTESDILCPKSTVRCMRNVSEVDQEKEHYSPQEAPKNWWNMFICVKIFSGNYPCQCWVKNNVSEIFSISIIRFNVVKNHILLIHMPVCQIDASSYMCLYVFHSVLNVATVINFSLWWSKWTYITAHNNTWGQASPVQAHVYPVQNRHNEETER
jgi:hypothetical protein